MRSTPSSPRPWDRSPIEMGILFVVLWTITTVAIRPAGVHQCTTRGLASLADELQLRRKRKQEVWRLRQWASVIGEVKYQITQPPRHLTRPCQDVGKIIARRTKS